jgi:hypothetical protein
MIVLTRFKSGGDMNPNPDINDVLRRFNRDTASLVVCLLGGLLFAAFAFAVLIPDPGQRMTSLQRRAIQAESTPSPAANAAKVEVVDSDAKRSANQEPLGMSTHIDQVSTESSSKESHVQTEAAAGSTPAPVLGLPGEGRSVATTNVSSWSPPQPKQSAHATTPAPVLGLPGEGPSIATANVSSWSPPQPKQSAHATRGKAPYRMGKSSGSLRDIDVKKRLIELWHQSLARTEKEKARRWAMFSKLETKKEASFTVRKQP